MKKQIFYVTMTDKFMSDWGRAYHLIDKFIVQCDTLEEAKTVERNALKRPEMKYINTTMNKPSYSSKKYLCTWTTYKELGEIWKR